MNLIQELKLKFRSGDVVTRLLIINCTVFVTLLLLDIFFTLFSFGPDKFAFIICNYSWSPYIIASRPWCLVTSLFASWGLWHLMFNMLTLYWLGGVFLKFYTSNHLRGLYILGGISGMILFTAVFTFIPSLQLKDWTQNIPLCSACILAFCTALAFRAPDSTEPIPLIGPVKIKHIVIMLAVVDVALLPHVSPAYDAAHLGAVATGWFFNYMLRKGKDITTPVTAVAVWLDKLFSPKK